MARLRACSSRRSTLNSSWRIGSRLSHGNSGGERPKTRPINDFKATFLPRHWRSETLIDGGIEARKSRNREPFERASAALSYGNDGAGLRVSRGNSPDAQRRTRLTATQARLRPECPIFWSI